MSYHLKQSEAVEDGIRRIARDQIDRARAELGTSDLPAAEAVHQARKRLKKLRALLRLVRPRLGKQRYGSENRRFRDLGRELSGPRDAEVMVQTLDGLTADPDNRAASMGFAALRRHLAAHRDAHARENGGALEHRMEEVAQALGEARKETAAWRLGEDGFRALGPGLVRSYRRGRKALGAVMQEPTDTRFHELRKRVKDHWYHTRLLKRVWPDAMGCRADLLKDLSDLLGDDHDLAVFRSTLADLPPGVASEAELEQLHDMVARRQKVLRRAALPLAHHVYAEKPKRLRKRLAAHWDIWQGW